MSISRGWDPWASHSSGWHLPLAVSHAWTGYSSGVLGFCLLLHHFPAGSCVFPAMSVQACLRRDLEACEHYMGPRCSVPTRFQAPESPVWVHCYPEMPSVSWRLESGTLLSLTLRPAVLGAHDSSGFILLASSTCLSPSPKGIEHPHHLAPCEETAGGSLCQPKSPQQNTLMR